MFPFSVCFEWSTIRLRPGRTNNEPSAHAPPPFDSFYCITSSPPLSQVPGARLLTSSGPLVYPFRSTTTIPTNRKTISVDHLGAFTTGSAAAAPTSRPLLSPLLYGSGATASGHHFDPSMLIAATAAVTGLPFPGRHQTAPASPPPTITLNFLHRPLQAIAPSSTILVHCHVHHPRPYRQTLMAI